MTSLLAAGRYSLDRRVGSGSFGSVYAGFDAEQGGEVAIKVEPSVAKNPQLLFEAKVYKSLAGRQGFPRLRHCGLEARRNVLVMDLLGPSLEDLHKLCRRRFSYKTVLMLADQLIERLEALHDAGYVHRDLKPENLLVGRGSGAGLLHLIDFGLSKRFKDVSTGQHIQFRDGKKLKGTMPFMSVGALRGAEQSRRDDLEAAGYVLLHLLRGALPWAHLQHQAFTKRVQYEKLAQAKGSISVAELCCDLAEGKEVLTEYFNYCRGLGFKECPDYSYLRNLFTEALRREGHEYDLVYDWTCPGDPQRSVSKDSFEPCAHAETEVPH